MHGISIEVTRIGKLDIENPKLLHRKVLIELLICKTKKKLRLFCNLNLLLSGNIDWEMQQ